MGLHYKKHGAHNTKFVITVSAEKDGKRMGEEMKKYLISKGIEAKNIILDLRGGNTAGEIDVCQKIIRENGGGHMIIVSTWYHIPRIWWLCLMRRNDATLVAATKHASWADLRIEPFKIVNAVLRPFKSSKIVG